MNVLKKVNRESSVEKCNKIHPQEGKEFSVDWFSGSADSWNEIISSRFNGKSNVKYLEIGAFEGKSTVFAAENICNGFNSTIHSVDHWLGSYAEKAHDGIAVEDRLYCRFVLNTKEYGQLSLYRDSSAKVLTHMNSLQLQDEHNKYDFIYIDASHWAKDVMVDAVLGWEILNLSGIMVFDDYGGWALESRIPHTGPQLAIDSFLNTYSTMYYDIRTNWQRYIEKIADLPRDMTHDVAEYLYIQENSLTSYYYHQLSDDVDSIGIL